MKIYEYYIELFRADSVITEYKAYKLLKRNPLPQEVNYLAVPWASLINQKRLDGVSTKPIEGGFTICQHIDYKRIIPALLKIGIEVLFTPHVYDDHKDIKVLPFPHYAVNGVKPTRKKDIWYCFIGWDSTSLINSNLRNNIFKTNHPKNTVIKRRKYWHFVCKRNWWGGNLSETQRRKEKTEYLDILARSRFSLCPRGTGASTIRFWESLKAGAIPVLLSDAMRLPSGADWDQCIIRMCEDEAKKIPETLGKISVERERVMREGCLKAYKNFSGDSFINCIKGCYHEIL